MPGCPRVMASSLLVAGLLVAALAPTPASSATLQGHVRNGASPLGAFVVALYATDPSHPRRCADVLGASPTASDGAFAIAYDAPTDADSVLYVIADGGSVDPSGKFPRRGKCRKLDGPVVLASVLGTAGPEPVPTDVTVNGRTTVATAYALAQFIDGAKIRGKAPGLQNAAGMAQNLVDATTGAEGAVLAGLPNGGQTETQGSFNSLANMVAACVASSTACSELFALTTPPRGRAPADTLQALVDLARNPATSTSAVDGLFALSKLPPAPYQPARNPDTPPVAWTLALRFAGDFVTMNGPGNIAIDAEGSLWVTNNYAWSPDPKAIVCASPYLLRFTPTGQYVADSPYTGGGLSGTGYGVTLDPTGNVWVGNFGFASEACPDPPPHDSVSEFTPDGTPVSPDTGYTEGSVFWPQATLSDRKGNIWIANCNNGIVTEYPHGEPSAAREFIADAECGTTAECAKPFDIGFDRRGRAYVTLNAASRVVVLKPDGTPTRHSPVDGTFSRPMGIKPDSRGTMWVASSAGIGVPCPRGIVEDSQTGWLTMIRSGGRKVSGPFTGGGLTLAWGVAIDGDDNVWVANFFGQRLSHFCGRKRKTCPPDADTGSPISPSGGYAFDGLSRNTGLAVDPSGNVWVVNNWQNDPDPLRNPGGFTVVAFVGLAPPVATPVIGPPKRP